MAVQRGQRPGFIQPRWWWWLGRSEMNPDASKRRYVCRTVFVKHLLSTIWGITMALVRSEKTSLAGCTAAVTTRLMLLVLIASLAACSKSNKPSYSEFASPEDAGNQLLAAAKSGNQDTILAIFGGPDSKAIISSGDPVEDKAAVAAFVTGYEQMHRWRKMPDGAEIMLIGAQNFPFPIPLKQNGGGKW